MYYWERDLSKAIYVQRAVELASRLSEVFANNKVKKYTFLGGQKVVHDAMDVANMLGEANRMRLDVPAEAKKRAALMRAALGLLETTGGHFATLHYKIRFPEAVLQDVDGLFTEVDKLVNEMLKSDAERLARG